MKRRATSRYGVINQMQFFTNKTYDSFIADEEHFHFTQTTQIEISNQTGKP